LREKSISHSKEIGLVTVGIILRALISGSQSFSKPERRIRGWIKPALLKSLPS